LIAADAHRGGIVASERAQPERTPLLGRIQRTTVAASAYEAIRESILDGRFKPDDLLTESGLALDLEVSRGTVREALARLREDGLVVPVPPRGLAVRRFSLEDVIDIFNARIGLESVAIRLCIRVGADVEPLERCVDAIVAAAAADDRPAVNARELEFHRNLCELSGNRCLHELHGRIGTQIRMALTMDYASDADQISSAEGHADVVAAIRAGDEDAAVRVLAEHIVGSITRQLGVSRDRFVGLAPS
jgi:DNA-binding GntR family transcriptional regulator